MKKIATVLATENYLPIDLTFHDVSVSLLNVFANKIVKHYYDGNLNTALQDLICKALAEQNFMLSRITNIQTSTEA